MEKIIKWFSENHVAANFSMLVVLLLGFSAWFKLKKEVMPEASLDTVSIQVVYPRATPSEVETGVLIPIEEAIADVEGIKKISSTGDRGIGLVNVEIESDYEIRDVMKDLETRVNAIDNFAEDAEKPIIQELMTSTTVISIAVSAEADEKTLKLIAEKIRDDLYNFSQSKPSGFIEGVERLFRGSETIKDIDLVGGREPEISIEISEKTLRKYGLTLEQVGRKIRETSIDLPIGSIKSSGGEVIIRTLSTRYLKDDFANISILNRQGGGVLYLSDIATIKDGFEDKDVLNQFNGKPSLILKVNRTGNQDSLIIAKMVKDYLKKVEKENRYPSGVDLTVWDDTSLILQGRLNLLSKNGIIGVLLVLLVLTLFLRPSLALLVAIGIPVSFAGGVLMMPVVGISINMISLFAFILVLGIVVDDAIVVGENVYTRIQEGMHPRKAAVYGTHEVGVIVIFGVLTTAVAFTPMLGIEGVSGQYWRNIPLVVIPTLLFSLLQSKFILPAHLAMLKPSKKDRKTNFLERIQQRVSKSLENFARFQYEPLIRVCLRFRYLVAACFIAVLLSSIGLIASGVIKWQFFPSVEGDILSMDLSMAPGTSFEQTQVSVDQITAAANRIDQRYEDQYGEKLIQNLLVSTGMQPYIKRPGGSSSPESNLGQVVLELTSAKGRKMSTRALTNEWRKEIGDIPGVSSMMIQSNAAGGGNAIDLKISGTRRDEVIKAVNFVKKELGTYPGVYDVNDGNQPGKDELRIVALKPQAQAMGLSLGQVSNQVRNAFEGYEVQRLQRGRDEVDVMVRYPAEERKSLANINQLRVQNSQGQYAPLPALAVMELDKSLTTITRVDRMPSIEITADINNAIANTQETVNKFNQETLGQLSSKVPQVAYEYGGEQNEQKESMTQMALGFLSALVVMFMLLAIPLKSYIKPFIIMSVIPFGIVGAIWGHFLMGMNLSIMSICGIIALAGIVVNDSLVLVDYVGRSTRANVPVFEAIAIAGKARFRAIVLTSLTTFVGIIPMVFETDMQAQFLIPMAVSLGFGVLFATFIMLVLVPCVYLIQQDFTWKNKGAL